jgi:hypothetical protein
MLNAMGKDGSNFPFEGKGMLPQGKDPRMMAELQGKDLGKDLRFLIEKGLVPPTGKGRSSDLLPPPAFKGGPSAGGPGADFLGKGGPQNFPPRPEDPGRGAEFDELMRRREEKAREVRELERRVAEQRMAEENRARGFDGPPGPPPGYCKTQMITQMMLAS